MKSGPEVRGYARGRRTLTFLAGGTQYPYFFLDRNDLFQLRIHILSKAYLCYEYSSHFDTPALCPISASRWPKLQFLDLVIRIFCGHGVIANLHQLQLQNFDPRS